MDDIRRIAKRANIELVEQGGLALVRHADAAAMLAALTAAEARILAIDGFVIENGDLFADEAAECDLTDFDALEEVAAEAEDFLAGFADSGDLYWDFVLDEED